jgi:hypothetical protein
MQRSERALVSWCKGEKPMIAASIRQSWSQETFSTRHPGVTCGGATPSLSATNVIDLRRFVREVAVVSP